MSCRLETTVLCLAIRTRAYDDLTFHLSSITHARKLPRLCSVLVLSASQFRFGCRSSQSFSAFVFAAAEKAAG